VLALTSKHPRARERFLALHDIAVGSNATQVAVRTGRCDETILRWLHAYNEQGPDAVSYRHFGGNGFGASMLAS
jgi:transposase